LLQQGVSIEQLLDHVQTQPLRLCDIFWSMLDLGVCEDEEEAKNIFEQLCAQGVFFGFTGPRVAGGDSPLQQHQQQQLEMEIGKTVPAITSSLSTDQNQDQDQNQNQNQNQNQETFRASASSSSAAAAATFPTKAMGHVEKLFLEYWRAHQPLSGHTA